MSCTTSEPEVITGRAVHVLGKPMSSDPSELSFSWSTHGGAIRGNGSTILIDTANLAPGSYQGN
jgi:hypothetical protein